MADAVGTVRVDLEANTGEFRDELSSGERLLREFGASLVGLGVAAGVGTTTINRVTDAVARFITDSLEAAKQADQVGDAFRYAFGDSADQANQWATQFAAAAGRTSVEVQGVAAEFENLTQQATSSNEQAARLAEQLTQFAYDIAEARNLSVQQASQGLEAILAGNTRALRNFGVVVSQQDLQQEALRRGIIATGETLTKEQQGLLGITLVLERNGAAAGELERQYGDLSSAQARANAAFEQAKLLVGNELTPAVTQLSYDFADFTHRLITGAEKIGQWIDSWKPARELLQWLGDYLAHPFTGLDIGPRPAQNARDASAALRGMTVDTQDLSQTTQHLASQIQANQRTGRSWTQQHARELERITSLYDPLQGALMEYNRQLEIARRGGLDLAQVQTALARQFLNSVDGLKSLRDRLTELPAPIRVLAEQELTKLAERADNADGAFRQFAQDLNLQYGTDNIRKQLMGLTNALNQGAISVEVYRRAKQDLLGTDERGNATQDIQTAQIERFNNRLQAVRSTILDLATGTKKWSDTWKELVLQWVQTQLLEPSLDRLLNAAFGSAKGGSKGGESGGLFSNSGFWSSVGSFIFGGKRGTGGPVTPNAAYLVGDHGHPEWFVPDQPGRIVEANQMRSGRNVTFNVYTPDANSFRKSRRQMARDERRMLGVE